ncbi:MAG: malonate transporter subunit MadL [Planctomycetota bacterium]|nr:malonate transporter subunit MadL [Planctomycetota bacterium]
MAIYGTALLAACLLAGVSAGMLLGRAMGIDADIGGVGIAMILLVLGTEKLRAIGKLGRGSSEGITYWSAMYIPIVVAMAAGQNVMGALAGGAVAIVAGAGSVAACFLLVGILSRSAKQAGESGASE